MVDYEDGSYNYGVILTAIGVGSVLLVAALFAIIWFKLKSRLLTKEEIRDFFHGDQASTGNADENTVDELKVEKMGFPKRFRLLPESYIIGKDTIHGVLIHRGIKVSLLLLTIDWNIELGSGEYGRCYKGFFRQNGQNIPVAIKTLKNPADKEYFKSFLKEIKVMAYVGEHENVVKFYGAMVERISERKDNWYSPLLR